MASGISKALRQAAESYANEIEQEENKKILLALQKTMQQVEDKLNKFLIQYMVDAYYNGYNPIRYSRSKQLKDSVQAYTELYNMGSSMGFTFGANFDETKMDHSTYTFTATWYRKRTKQWVSKEYTITSDKVDELKILEFFQDGIHPNAVKAGYTNMPNAEPLFTDDLTGSVPEIIEAWVDDGGIVDIFLKELNKLH